MVSVPHSTPCRDCAAKPPHDPARRSWDGEEARRNKRALLPAAKRKIWNPRRGEPGGQFSCRIKAGVADGTTGQSQLPAVRAVAGVLRCIKSGVKIRPVLSPLRSRSLKSYCHSEKTGVTPQKAVYRQERRNRLPDSLQSHLRWAPPHHPPPPQKLHRNETK